MNTKISLRDATEKLLRRGCYRHGLLVPQIVAALTSNGLWSTDAPTPDNTLRTVLCRELAKGKGSKFHKTVSDDGIRFSYAR